MAQSVEVPGIGTLEFPDGMSQQDMAAAIRKNFPQIHNTNVNPRDANAMAAEGVGPGDAALIGVGRTFSKIGQGVQQLLPQSAQEREQQKADEAQKDAAYSALRVRRPIATAIGEGVPYVAVPASMGILPAAATVGGIEALKYGSPQERMQSGALGAGGTFVGGMVGKALGGFLSPMADDAINATKAAALRSANAIGYKPRLSELTGSPTMARLEDMAARVPGGAGIMEEFSRGNAKALNRAAAQSIGANANELSPSVMSEAARKISKAFDDVATLPGKPIGVGPQVASAADDVLRKFSKQIPKQQDPELAALAQNLRALAQNKGKIDGESYNLLRSGLSESSFDSTGTTKTLYGKLLNAVDDSAESSLRQSGNDALAEALKTARRQYANKITLEKGATIEGGNVSPAKVASTLRTQNPAAFREGRMSGPLYDIAQVGENLKPLRAGSPTAEREALFDLAVKAPVAYGAAQLSTNPLLRSFYGAQVMHPALGSAASGAAQLANPTARQLAAALASNFIVPPVMAEK